MWWRQLSSWNIVSCFVYDDSCHHETLLPVFYDDSFHHNILFAFLMTTAAIITYYFLFWMLFYDDSCHHKILFAFAWWQLPSWNIVSCFYDDSCHHNILFLFYDDSCHHNILFPCFMMTEAIIKHSFLFMMTVAIITYCFLFLWWQLPS